MPTVSEAMDHLSQRHKDSQQNSLLQIISTLIFSEMRIDPGNLSWQRGDVLLYSSVFSGVIEDALAFAGSNRDSISNNGLSNLDTVIKALKHPQRLFCIVAHDEANRFTKYNASLKSGICIVSSSPPPNQTLWNTIPLNGESPNTLAECLSKHINETQQPLWLVMPEQTGKTTMTTSTQPFSGLPPLAERMSRLGTETAFAVLAEVNALRAEGKDIITFGIGEPDFDSPKHVKEAAKNAIDDNQTHYGPSAGLPELRSAIARYIERTRHIHVSSDEVVVTPGAKPIIFDTIMSLVNPGDEVLYPNPGFPIYESVIEWVGAKAVPLPLWEANNWSFSIDELESRITEKTKLIIINSPGNPTGTMIEMPALEAIARIAQEHNLWVISDEIYSQIVFDTEFHSIAALPGMKERTIIVDGFSKTYAMTGWRMGFGIMNRDLAAQVAQIETNIDSCTCSFSQIAGVQALDGPQHEAEEMALQFKERSKIIVDLLNGIEGIGCLPSQGAFYALANITGACGKLGYKDAKEFQHALLYEAGIAVLPRTCFGKKNEGEDQEYIRLSYATSMDNINQGIQRIKEFVEKP